MKNPFIASSIFIAMALGASLFSARQEVLPPPANVPAPAPIERAALRSAANSITFEDAVKPEPGVIPVANAQEGGVAEHPSRLIIPSIGLDAPVELVGLNAKGEMDVPDGKTNSVGWYQYGTTPGEWGSAVLDAHVFAAFKNLKNLAPESEVIVMKNDGSRLRFVVSSAREYPLAEVSADALFNRTGGRFLHLITCAGTFDPVLGTYDRRLIVYAELADS